MKPVRVHVRNSRDIKEFLLKNKMPFRIERTSTGFSTLIYNNVAYYVGDKATQRALLNKILNFHNDVKKSKLFKFIDNYEVNDIQLLTSDIEKTLLYKGFSIDIQKEKKIDGVIKIDLNSAYWQTCKITNCIKGKTFREVNKNCLKQNRLKITGTLGKKILVTEYVDGKKNKIYIKPMPKRRIIFQNIYNRLRKYVDELMVYCWRLNPQNFIGYYVDCLWIKEYDPILIEMLMSVYQIKMEIVDIVFETNRHNKTNMIEFSEEGMTRYDGNYIYNEFVMYKNFYNFTIDLKNTKLDIWKQ